MDCLDLVPAYKRHLKKYLQAEDTDSKLAGYLSDGVKALSPRWSRTYIISNPSRDSYIVTPDIAQTDERPIILAASIIYKGSLLLGTFRDGDFAYDLPTGSNNPVQRDVEELKNIIPAGPRLVAATTASMYGYENWYNPESYRYFGYFMNILGI
jgi:hypothetical protein